MSRTAPSVGPGRAPPTVGAFDPVPVPSVGLKTVRSSRFIGKSARTWSDERIPMKRLHALCMVSIGTPGVTSLSKRPKSWRRDVGFDEADADFDDTTLVQGILVTRRGRPMRYRMCPLGEDPMKVRVAACDGPTPGLYR